MEEYLGKLRRLVWSFQEDSRDQRPSVTLGVALIPGRERAEVPDHATRPGGSVGESFRFHFYT